MKNILIVARKDIFNILILSLPIFAIFSIFLMELVLIFISINFLLNSFKEKNFYYFNNFFFKFFTIFYFYLLFNFIFQIEKIETYSVIFYFRYIIYTLAIYFFLDRTEKLFFNFLKVIFFCVIVLFLDALFQTLLGYNIVGLEIIEKNRPSSFFGDELILGSYIFRLLPFVFLIFLIDRNFLFPKSKYLLLLLSFLIIFLSGERTSMVLSLFLMLINIFLLKKDKFFKNLSYIVIFFCIVLSITLAFSKKYQYRFISEPLKDLSLDYKVTQDLLAGYENKPKIIFFSGLHHNLMITSFRIFNQNKIFGSGPRSYRNECENYKINRYSCDTHPHNYYIQLLSETGLIGVSFLIFLILVIIYQIYYLRNEREINKNLELCILGFYISALWPIIPSGNFFNNWLSIMTFLPFSFYLYINKNNNFMNRNKS